MKIPSWNKSFHLSERPPYRNLAANKIPVLAGCLVNMIKLDFLKIFCWRKLFLDSSLWYPSPLWFIRMLFLKTIVWTGGIHLREHRWKFIDQSPENWPQSPKMIKIFFLWTKMFPLNCFFSTCRVQFWQPHPKSFNKKAEKFSLNSRKWWK